MFFGDNKDLENLICIKTWGQGLDLVNDKIKLLIPTTRPCESNILIIMISEARVQILFRTEFFGLTCLNTVVLKIPIIVPILSYNSIDSVAVRTSHFYNFHWNLLLSDTEQFKIVIQALKK